MAAPSKVDKSEESKVSDKKEEEQPKSAPKPADVVEGETQIHNFMQDAADSPLVSRASEVKQCYALLEQAAALFEPRFTTRVLRALPSIRKALTTDKLSQIIHSIYPPGAYTLGVFETR